VALVAVSNHNTQEELVGTGYQMESWVRDKGKQVLYVAEVLMATAIPVNNTSGWAFGGVGPMSSGGMQNPTRQLGGSTTFAQSLSGSTPATPLDLS
jgi:hypothetical protein